MLLARLRRKELTCRPWLIKSIRITEDRVQRLGKLASAIGTSEDALIEKAIDIFLELSQEESAGERQAWSAASLPALKRVWDNEADAVYDNWRELYGIQQG